MPQIAQYDAGNVGLNPTEIGVDATAQAARRVGSLYHQEGEVIGGAVSTVGQQAEQYMAHREISQGSAAYSGMFAKATDDLQQAAKNADPNDPSAVQKLTAGFDDQFDKYLDGFHTPEGQRWAEAHIDNLRQHLFTSAAATVSSMAKDAVTVNSEKTVNNLATGVSLDPSMGSIDFALNAAKSTLGGMVDTAHNIDAATGASIKTEWSQKAGEQIVKTGIASIIAKNPNADLTPLYQKYSDFLKPGEMQQFQKAAQVQAKQIALIDRQTLATNRQIAEQTVRASTNKAIADNVTFDQQTGKPVINPNLYKQSMDILKSNPDAPNAGEAFRAIASWGESQEAKGAKPADDPVVKSDLMTRMFSADNPTTTLDLMKARADGKISDPSFQAMHGLVTELEQSPIKGPVWDDTIGAVKGELILSNVGLPGQDIKGEGNYAQWAQSFIPQYMSMKRAGTLPPNALNVNDPKSMISQSMEPFKRSVAQRAQDYLSVLGGGTSAPPPTVTTKEAFDALKSGTTYTGADGKTYRKP
jgi:hypothetical protein